MRQASHPLSARQSAEFRANSTRITARLAQPNSATSQEAARHKPGRSAISTGSPARAKMLPRQRIALLLDPGTPFLELSSLAANHGL